MESHGFMDGWSLQTPSGTQGASAGRPESPGTEPNEGFLTEGLYSVNLHACATDPRDLPAQ